MRTVKILAACGTGVATSTVAADACWRKEAFHPLTLQSVRRLKSWRVRK